MGCTSQEIDGGRKKMHVMRGGVKGGSFLSSNFLLLKIIKHIYSLSGIVNKEEEMEDREQLC